MKVPFIKYLVDGVAVTLLLALVLGAIWLSIKKEALPERIKKIEKLKKGRMDFAFYDLNQKQHLFSDFHDHVVLINIWATWCAPCVEEFPSMMRLAESLRKDFTLIAVTNESPDAVRNFLNRFQQKPPSHLIVATSEEVYGVLNPAALPESFLFEKKGKLFQKIIGPRVWDSLEWKNNIKNLINSNKY